MREIRGESAGSSMGLERKNAAVATATRTTNTATIPSGFFHVFAVCFISYSSLLVQLTGIWIPTIL